VYVLYSLIKLFYFKFKFSIYIYICVNNKIIINLIVVVI